MLNMHRKHPPLPGRGRTSERRIWRLRQANRSRLALVQETELFRHVGQVGSPEIIPHRRPRTRRIERSEEHTSELQSRLHLVCRLLLEKKKLRSTVMFTVKPLTAIAGTSESSSPA